MVLDHGGQSGLCCHAFSMIAIADMSRYLLHKFAFYVTEGYNVL